MKNNITELVFILDRSGSMSGLESDTIGGFNSMLERQNKEDGKALVTTVLFDHEYEVLHDRYNILKVNPITDEDYFVRGVTALLDAIGRTIQKTVRAIKHTDESERPSKVLMVIITDGAENASTEYTYDKVKEMIEYQKSKYSWEFIFLGANIDAIATAKKFGIDEDRASNYHADSEGTKLNYESLSDVVSELRANAYIKPNWKEKIEKDYSKRKR